MTCKYMKLNSLFVKIHFVNCQKLYKMSVNQDLVLEWIRAFSCVDKADCEKFDDLSYGFALSKLYNFAADGKVDLNSLQAPKKADDWLTAMKNIRVIGKEIEAPFNEKGIKVQIEATTIARRSKLEALPNFVVSFICFMFCSPKAEEVKKITLTCSQEVQNEIRSILIANNVGGNANETAEAQPKKEEKIAPKTEPEEKPAQSPAKQPEPNRAELRKLEIKNRTLKSELERLKKELSDVQSSSASAPELPPEAATLKSELDAAMAENAKLEKECAEIPDVPDSTKNSLQSEIAELQQKLQKYTEEANSPLLLEKYAENKDPEIQDLLKQIKEAEDVLKPEYETQLLQQVEKLKDAATKMKKAVKSKQKEAGDIKVEPENGEAANLEIENNNLTTRNNDLNKQIVEILTKLDAAENFKSRRSFLEHLRTSDAFLSIH